MSTSSKKDKRLNPFRPRARLIRALGQELISNESVALIELVKNSYDADATRVKVRFVGEPEEGKGIIEVLDDGNGMDLTTVRSVFLEPATNSKRGSKAKRRSPKFKRQMLGAKGIGRFASSRLSDELELFTRMRRADKEVFGVFDWTQFDDEDLYLDEVLVLTDEQEPSQVCPDAAIRVLWEDSEAPTKSEQSHGTIMRMNKLRQTWTPEDFEVLCRGLSRLISPFKKIKDFRIFVDLPEQFADFAIELSPPPLIKYPHYVVKGTVQSSGKFNLKFRVEESGKGWENESGVFAFSTKDKDQSRLLVLDSEKTAKELEKDEEIRKPVSGPLSLELRFWDRDQLGNIEQQLNTSTIKDIRKDLNAIAGINIYRDDFRVLPYGEPNNDWLRLDIRRVQKPQQRFSNNNIAGQIEITAEQNPTLTDQTNRQGLDENQALADVVQMMLEVVEMVERRRQEVRPKQKGKTSRTPIGGIFEPLDFSPIRQQLKLAYPDDKELNALVDQTERNFSRQLEEIQTVLGRYHSLATLGKLIDVVLHDGRHPVSTVLAQAKLAEKSIAKDGECEKRLESIKKNLKKINNQGEVLQGLFRRIEPFGGRKKGRPAPLYLETIISDTVEIYSSEIKRLGVHVTLPTKPSTLVRVDPAEIQEVLANLLSNSLHWLQHTSKSKRKIKIDLKRNKSDHIEITIADSGTGVKAKDRQLIFDPYYSTKPNGVGLGLSIAGEIVSDFYGGKLELLKQSTLGGATFRITLKKRV